MTRRWWGLVLVLISSGCGASLSAAPRETANIETRFDVRIEVQRERVEVPDAERVVAHNPYVRPPSSPYGWVPESPY